MFKKICIICLVVITSQASSCWTSVELSKFAQDEFNEIARISLKDAVTCKPIVDAKFTMLGKEFTSNGQGIVILPLPPENIDADLPIKIEKKGYITSKENIHVTFGSYWNNLFLMSKELPLNSARFVLSWDAKPSDLDLHLKSDDFHISYRKMKNFQNRAFLDRDAMQGYGAETITLNKLNKYKTYKVLVHRYSNDANIDTKGQVRVYLNNKADKTVRLPDSSAECFEIAQIKNNQVIYKTKISHECK